MGRGERPRPVLPWARSLIVRLAARRAAAVIDERREEPSVS
jgi:hypothetical protein